MRVVLCMRVFYAPKTPSSDSDFSDNEESETTAGREGKYEFIVTDTGTGLQLLWNIRIWLVRVFWSKNLRGHLAHSTQLVLPRAACRLSSQMPGQASLVGKRLCTARTNHSRLRSPAHNTFQKHMSTSKHFRCIVVDAPPAAPVRFATRHSGQP